MVSPEIDPVWQFSPGIHSKSILSPGLSSCSIETETAERQQQTPL